MGGCFCILFLFDQKYKMSLAVFVGLSTLFVGLLYIYFFKIKKPAQDDDQANLPDEPHIVNRLQNRLRNRRQEPNDEEPNL